MSVRTYNPSVRVGNWNEDIQLEEDGLKDFLTKRERGNLLFQKTAELRNTILEKVDLSTSNDGCVRFGDVLQLVNPAVKDGSRQAAVLGVNVDDPCQSDMPGPEFEYSVAGAGLGEPCVRTSFVVQPGVDGGCEPGECLKYGQTFSLATVFDMFLQSDTKSFHRYSKKSRHNEVRIVPKCSRLCDWKVLPFNPAHRMELEWSNVPANEKILIVHSKTNQALCLESDHKVRTAFGSEFEVSSFTDLDSHKAEKESNHWLLALAPPADR